MKENEQREREEGAHVLLWQGFFLTERDLGDLFSNFDDIFKLNLDLLRHLEVESKKKKEEVPDDEGDSEKVKPIVEKVVTYLRQSHALAHPSGVLPGVIREMMRERGMGRSREVAMHYIDKILEHNDLLNIFMHILQHNESRTLDLLLAIKKRVLSSLFPSSPPRLQHLHLSSKL